MAYSRHGRQARLKAQPIRLQHARPPCILEVALNYGSLRGPAGKARNVVPEPTWQEADHTKRTDPGEKANTHRQPDAEVEAHEGQYCAGAHRTCEERKE